MFCSSAIQMCNYTLEKIFDQFRTHFEGFLICFQMSGYQQIFCHVNQPVCIVINCRVQLFPDCRIKCRLFLHQHIGTAADVCERCT